MKKVAGLLFVILIATACNGKLEKTTAPDNLIPHTKMVEILSNMMILEAHIQTRYQNVQRFHKIMTASGKKYLQSESITVEQYESSFDYYVSEGDEMKEILQEAMDKLTIESNQLQGQTSVKDTI